VTARRSIALAIGAFCVFALVSGLSGCTATPITGLQPSPVASGQPSVGQCWNAAVAQADEWSAWGGQSAASCTALHVLYTYKVATIAGETGSSWASSGNGSTLSAAVAAKASHACTLSTLLPKAKWNQQLIQQYFFVPSKPEWRAGARWVRCDVGVLATGTTLADEHFASLPRSISTFVDAVASDPARFELCVNSPQPVTAAGPLDDPNATLADCAGSPEWSLKAHGRLPGSAGAGFPSESSANAESTAICSPAAAGAEQIWIAYLPTRADWSSGDREVDCWVGQKQVAGGQAA
jgi:hypothetical protein